MLFFVMVSGLGLLALPGLACRGGRRLHPAEWARLCLVAIAGGGVVVEVSVVLYAAPTLARSSGIPVLAELCQRMLGPLAPGGQAAGWTAAAVATILPALALSGWSRTRRAAAQARVEHGLGRHNRYGNHHVIVMPTTHLVAVTVPTATGISGGGQIVVSDGLIAVLAPAELGAVLRHEAAHINHKHHRYLVAAAIVDHAFAWFPFARRSTATLRLALERWADEDAAATGAGRSAVRDALLAVTASLVASPSAAAFSAADTIGERLDALDTHPPRPPLGPHMLLYFPGTALGAMALVALSSWASGASAVLALAGQCTT